MEEFFRFIQESGRERSRLTHEERAIRDSVNPPVSNSKQGDKPPTDQAIGDNNAGVVS